MKYTVEQVKEALKHVMDPDIKKDLITLNMIKDIETSDNRISFSLELTTPACPLKNKIKEDCINAIKEHIDKNVEVDVKFASRVTTPQNIEDRTFLKDVKNIIAVASGKGGVGKSTVASNLAVGLAKTGAKVGIIDADIYGPSIPMMFDIIDAKPLVDEIEGRNSIMPVVKYEVKVLSIGFFVDRAKALIWRGPMAANALKQLITEADWGELDYLVIDMPPGTGDIQLTLVQTIPITGVVIVSTPQKVSLADAEKGIEMFRNEKINVPVLGLVENMSYFTPKELPDNKYYIFGKEGCKKLSEKYNIPLLGEIPLVQGISESGDNGAPIVMESSTPAAKAFMDMSKKVAQAVAIRNAMVNPTKIVELKK